MFLLPNNFCAVCGFDLHNGAPSGMYNGHKCKKGRVTKCTSCGGKKGDCLCIIPGMQHSARRPSIYYFDGETVK